MEVTRGKAELCREILEELPDWFGIPEAVDDYVEQVRSLQMFGVRDEGRALGMVSVRRHFDTAGELHVLGVRSDVHRRGIGRSLVKRVEQVLASEGRSFLTVKTLSPSMPDEHYDQTRAFYQSVGFQLLEEFPTLWDPRNPCVVMIKPL